MNWGPCQRDRKYCCVGSLQILHYDVLHPQYNNVQILCFAVPHCSDIQSFALVFPICITIIHRHSGVSQQLYINLPSNDSSSHTFPLFPYGLNTNYAKARHSGYETNT